MDNEREFIEAMKSEDPDVLDYIDALYYALNHVDTVESKTQVRYFGRVAGGVFYADGAPENARWLPGFSLREATDFLWDEFGPEFVEELDKMTGV